MTAVVPQEHTVLPQNILWRAVPPPTNEVLACRREQVTSSPFILKQKRNGSDSKRLEEAQNELTQSASSG